MTIESVADFYLDTQLGQEIRRRGLEQGSASVLVALLRARFGDHPQIPAIAEHLAHTWNDDTSVRIITEATALEDLSGRLVPSQPSTV